MRSGLIFLLLLPSLAFALPKKVELWFVSKDKKLELTKALKGFETTMIMSRELAFNNSDCVPMGDGCFHPQLGYIEKGEAKKNVVEDATGNEDFKKGGVDLIDCDHKEYFNIFCEKRKNINSGTEVWIDISSSFRELDFSTDPLNCLRKKFVDRVMTRCAGKVSFTLYDTVMKNMAASSDACIAYGLNNQEKLISWIDKSSAEKLLILTDTDEFTTRMKDYLDSIGATIKGDLPGQSVTLSDFASYGDTFTCQ